MVLVALRLGFATLIFLLSILVPPLFLLLSGLLGDGWAQMRAFGIYLALFALAFFCIVAVNYQFA